MADETTARAACCALIAQMPAAGLAETLDTLRAYLDFYTTPRSPAVPLPEPMLVPSRFVGYVTTPPLIIDTEDD